MTTTRKNKRANGAAPKAPTEDTLRARVRAVHDAAAAAFVGRDDVVHGIICAMLAGEHTLLIGPPGTGKSALARVIVGAIVNSNLFEYLLTRYTEPNEVLGPVDLKAWADHGTYKRKPGYLPDATHFFADEIFKANSSILNALLAILNERVFHEAGQAIPVPLRSCIGASNELPEGGTAGELSALYDRFVVRFDVQPPAGEDAFVAIVGEKAEVPSIVERIDLADIDAARALVAKVKVPEDTVRAMHGLSEALAVEGISVSHRRWKKAKKVMQAHAWLEGLAEVDPLHFDILEHVLWDEPDQRPKVRGIVGKTSAPKLAEAVEVRDAVIELVQGLPSTGNVSTEGQAVMRELNQAIEQVEKLLADHEAAGHSDAVAKRIEKVADELDEAAEKLEDRLKAELFSGGRRRRGRDGDR